MPPPPPPSVRVRFLSHTFTSDCAFYPFIFLPQPSAFSLGDLCVPPMANVLKVFLENGQTKSFKYDNTTTVQVCVYKLQGTTQHHSLATHAFCLRAYGWGSAGSTAGTTSPSIVHTTNSPHLSLTICLSVQPNRTASASRTSSRRCVINCV